MHLLKLIKLQVLPSRAVKVEYELAAELRTESAMDGGWIQAAQANLQLPQSQPGHFRVCLQSTAGREIKVVHV